MSDIEWGALFNDAKSATFEALPPGEYDVYIAEAEAQTAKESGNNMIKTKFQVESGPHAGRVMWRYFVLNPDKPTALGFWFRNMKALGIEPEYFTGGNPSMEAIAAELTGKRARVKTVIEKYNNQEQTKIDRINPAVGPAPVAGSPAPAAAPTATATPAGVPAPAPAKPSTPAPSAPTAF